MSQRAKKTISIVTILLTACLAAIILRVTMAGEGDSDSDGPLVVAEPTLVMDTGVEILLLRMSLDPDAFAAAGISGATLQSALAAEEENLEGALTTLETHDAACAEAKVTVDALHRKVRRGQATNEEVTQLATVRTTLATATAARTTFFDGLAADLLENFAAGSTTTLRQIRANQRWKNIPVAYRVEARTEAQWVEVREALAAKKTHLAMDLDVPQSAVTFLAALDSDTDVSTAQAALESNLATVQSTWDSVFGH